MMTAGLAGSLAGHASSGRERPQNQSPRPSSQGTVDKTLDDPIIGMVIYPKMVAQDLIGPWTVFNLMRDAKCHLVARDMAPVETELGLHVPPTHTFATCPRDLDVLFVPGGLAGTIDLIDDETALDFIADRGARARYVTSDCTGSLALGAAGLLKGFEATSHWYVRDHLKHYGATVSDARVVVDRSRITGGGVTAGIDFALTLAGIFKGVEMAMVYQLLIEYAPAPPFDAGTPASAPKELVEMISRRRAPVIQKAREQAERIGVKRSAARGA